MSWRDLETSGPACGSPCARSWTRQSSGVTGGGQPVQTGRDAVISAMSSSSAGPTVTVLVTGSNTIGGIVSVTGIVSLTGNVNIDYEGGGATSFTTLAANVANSGTYAWLVSAATFAVGTNPAPPDP